jgi:hypothetical protein
MAGLARILSARSHLTGSVSSMGALCGTKHRSMHPGVPLRSKCFMIMGSRAGSAGCPCEAGSVVQLARQLAKTHPSLWLCQDFVGMQRAAAHLSYIYECYVQSDAERCDFLCRYSQLVMLTPLPCVSKELLHAALAWAHLQLPA